MSESSVSDAVKNPCSSRLYQFEGSDNQPVADIVWWTNGVTLPSIAFVGILCNTMNLFILISNDSARRMPSWHLIVYLAIFDILFLVFATLEISPASYSLSLPVNLLHTQLILFIRTLASTFYKASILVVVSFNVERYICVCRPMIAYRIDARTNKIAILVSFLIGLICSIHWPIVYQITECWDQVEHHEFTIVTLRDHSFFRVYYKIMDYTSLIVFNTFPIILLLILNFRLVRTLRRVVRRDSSIPDIPDRMACLNGTSSNNNTSALITSSLTQNHNQRSATNGQILFAVVLLLFICIGPQAPARLLYEYYGEYHVSIKFLTDNALSGSSQNGVEGVRWNNASVQ